jgi:hypothetical protein
MAGEAILTIALQFAKGTIQTQIFASGSISRDISGSNYIRNVQAVGISKEAMLLGDVGTPGLTAVHNLEAPGGNFVLVYPNGTDAAAIELKAGDWQVFRFAPGTTPTVKADTAPVNLEYLMLPD